MITPLLVHAVHWLAALIVLAEALNKLERTDPLARGIGAHARLVVCAKVLAWVLLAAGSGGALVRPLLQLQTPTLYDAAFVAGFALLIVRSRMKEKTS